MNPFADLYSFVDLAEKNRKYPTNTAHGRRAALRLFEKSLNQNELNSIDTIPENIEEIFRNVVKENQDKYNIASLNTYRMRFIKVLEDYQRYGVDPGKIQNWIAKPRKSNPQPVNSGDIKDIRKDTSTLSLSKPLHTPVHNLELAMDNGGKAIVSLPKSINKKEAEMIKKIIDSLVE